jgi:hypothetical protein
MQEGNMLFSKSLGAAALLAALCAPTMSLAGEISKTVMHPVVHSDSGCRKSWNSTYHYRYHYRAYRPRIRVTPRHYYPRKKKKPLIGF